MRIRQKGAAALAATLGLGLVLAACGGSDDSSLTKAEFVKQGNAICKKGAQEINAGFEKVAKTIPKNQQPSQAQLEKFANDTLIPSVQGQIDDIRALDPPSGDEDQVNALLDSAQEALDKVKQDPSLAVGGKSDPFKKANQQAKAYGLTVCGAG
jgi:hypothetical protein